MASLDKGDRRQLSFPLATVIFPHRHFFFLPGDSYLSPPASPPFFTHTWAGSWQRHEPATLTPPKPDTSPMRNERQTSLCGSPVSLLAPWCLAVFSPPSRVTRNTAPIRIIAAGCRRRSHRAATASVPHGNGPRLAGCRFRPRRRRPGLSGRRIRPISWLTHSLLLLARLAASAR
jgi:hypothetical protein